MAAGGQIELAYHRIRPPAAELNWSQHVELLPVTNKADKRRLEQRVIRENLSRRQIRQEVRQLEKKLEAPASPNKTKVILPQPCRQEPNRGKYVVLESLKLVYYYITVTL